MKKFFVLTGALYVFTLHMQAQNYVGIGDASFTPVNLLQVHKNAASGVTFHGTNTSTGLTASDGFQIIQSGLTIQLNQLENSDLNLATNNTTRMTISGAGNVGIGNASPAEKLDVAGNIRFTGALMPNGTAGTSMAMLLSNGTGSAPSWSTFYISNPASMSAFGKWYTTIAWGGTWANNTYATFTVTDPDCTTSSQMSMSIDGPWNALYPGITIRNIVCENGQFRVTMVNQTGSGLTGGIPVAFTAFY